MRLVLVSLIITIAIVGLVGGCGGSEPRVEEYYYPAEDNTEEILDGVRGILADQTEAEANRAKGNSTEIMVMAILAVVAVVATAVGTTYFYSRGAPTVIYEPTPPEYQITTGGSWRAGKLLEQEREQLPALREARDVEAESWLERTLPQP